MKNTSLGYHTFSFFQRTPPDIFDRLRKSFKMYAKKNADVKRFPIEKGGKTIGWEYCNNEEKGIQWQLFSLEANNGFLIQGVNTIINPKALLEREYISAANEHDLTSVKEIYNNRAYAVSSFLVKFGECPVNRADYCLNIDVNELELPCSPKQMMKLIKRGNIPKYYKERCTYDEKSHRMASCPNSFYLESKSAVVNYYWKYPQQTEKHPNFINKEASRDVIRLEIQCKYPKLYYMVKDEQAPSKQNTNPETLSLNEQVNAIINDPKSPSIPLNVALSDKIAEDVVRCYFYKIIRKGDYFTLDGARDIVESFRSIL